MKKSENLILSILVLALLLAIGIASRFVLLDLPNVKPLAAIAMFAAFWFRSFRVAGLALVLIVLASNIGLSSCPWQITCGVVGGLLVAAGLGRRLHRRVGRATDVTQKPVGSLLQLGGSALAMSVAFFLISNFSVWAMGQWYPLTLSGLVQCFVAAVPFFKYTFCGDMVFTGALFSAWWMVATVAQPLIDRRATAA